LIWSAEWCSVTSTGHEDRSQWPRGLRRSSASVRLLGCGFEYRRGMDVCCCKCRVLSGRGLCNRPITPRGETYRVWFRNLKMREPGPTRGYWATKKNAAFHYAVFLRSPVTPSYGQMSHLLDENWVFFFFFFFF
jgi:hypothetical protein